MSCHVMYVSFVLSHRVRSPRAGGGALASSLGGVGGLLRSEARLQLYAGPDRRVPLVLLGETGRCHGSHLARVRGVDAV
jgi:hypothetical protein